MGELLKYLIPAVSPWVIVLVVLYFAPDKAEKWASIVLRGMARLKGSFHRSYVTHDLQGRVNDFIQRLKKDVPGLDLAKLRVEWVEPSISRKAFIDKGEVVLRLRRDDPEDHNFVHGSYLFVSQTLLAKPKRYVSPSQREALDIFICGKVIEAEKPAVRGVFLDEYLHPKTADPKNKVGRYIDDFATVDEAALFFPVLVQELDYLGDKVFGRRKTGEVVKEVDQLVAFLKPIATRVIGEKNDLTYEGTYCRFGLVIIGKPSKLLTSIEPYVGYIRKALLKNDIETIYLLALAENKKRLQEIHDRFRSDYDWIRMVRFSSTLTYADRRVKAAQVLVILRKKGLPLIQPSAP